MVKHVVSMLLITLCVLVGVTAADERNEKHEDVISVFDDGAYIHCQTHGECEAVERWIAGTHFAKKNVLYAYRQRALSLIRGKAPLLWTDVASIRYVYAVQCRRAESFASIKSLQRVIGELESAIGCGACEPRDVEIVGMNGLPMRFPGWILTIGLVGKGSSASGSFCCGTSEVKLADAKNMQDCLFANGAGSDAVRVVIADVISRRTLEANLSTIRETDCRRRAREVLELSRSAFILKMCLPPSKFSDGPSTRVFAAVLVEKNAAVAPIMTAEQMNRIVEQFWNEYAAGSHGPLTVEWASRLRGVFSDREALHVEAISEHQSLLLRLAGDLDQRASVLMLVGELNPYTFVDLLREDASNYARAARTGCAIW